MAIVAAFDLETQQSDAINLFANSEIDKPIYGKLPNGWIDLTDTDLVLLLLF